jgi:inositol-pentakisphosphate 2-kinase
MTLRDVTVYLRYPAHIEDEKDGLTDPADIEARLGDLDIKSPAKAEEWSHRERLLISEGWYTGTEAEEDRQPLCCALYR